MFLTWSFSHFKALLFFFFFLFLPFVLLSSALAQHSTQLSPSSSLSSQRWPQASSPAKHSRVPFELLQLWGIKTSFSSSQTYHFHHGCRCPQCRPRPSPPGTPFRCPPCSRNSHSRCQYSVEINLRQRPKLLPSVGTAAPALVMPLTRKNSEKPKKVWVGRVLKNHLVPPPCLWQGLLVKNRRPLFTP